MWGIQVGRVDIAPVLKGFLDGGDVDDDRTAETDTLTTLAGDLSDSESDSDDNAEDFAMENEPRPPPAELMYGGQGKCKAPSRATIVPDARPFTPPKKGKKRGKRGSRKKGRRTGARPRRAKGSNAQQLIPPKSEKPHTQLK